MVESRTIFNDHLEFDKILLKEKFFSNSARTTLDVTHEVDNKA